MNIIRRTSELCLADSFKGQAPGPQTPKGVASRTCISTCSYLGLQKTSHPNHTHTGNPKAVSFGLLLTLTAGLQRSFDIRLVVAGVPGLPIKGNAGVGHR